MFGFKNSHKQIQIKLIDLAPLWLEEDVKDRQIQSPEIKFTTQPVRRFWKERVAAEAVGTGRLTAAHIELITEILTYLEKTPGGDNDKSLLTHSIETAMKMAVLSKDDNYGAALIVGLLHDMGEIIQTGSALPDHTTPEQKLYWWISKRSEILPRSEAILNALNCELDDVAKGKFGALLKQAHIGNEAFPVEKEMDHSRQKGHEDAVKADDEETQLNIESFSQEIEKVVSKNGFDAFVWEGGLYISPETLRTVVAKYIGDGSQIIDISRVKEEIKRLLPETTVINGNYRLKYADHNIRPDKRYYFVFVPKVLSVADLSRQTPRDAKGRWLRKIELVKEIDRFETSQTH